MTRATAVAASTSGAGTSSGGSACDLGECEDCLTCSLETVCTRLIDACNADAACTQLLDCVGACPADDPQTQDNEQLQCACGNQEGNCSETSPPGSCAGDYPDGIAPYAAVYECVNVSCATVCD